MNALISMDHSGGCTCTFFLLFFAHAREVPHKMTLCFHWASVLVKGMQTCLVEDETLPLTFWLLSTASSSSVVQPLAWPESRDCPLCFLGIFLSLSCQQVFHRAAMCLQCSANKALSVAWWGEGSFSCLIPLVLDNTGPGLQAPLDP